MRKVLPIIVVAYLFIASAIILTSGAQVFQNCRRIQSCNVTTGTNSTGNTQCTISRTIEACDGSHPGGSEACTNIGCVTNCNCTCQGTSPNFTATATSWVDDCEDIVKSNIRQCDGCPTPTPTPPGPENPESPPPDGGGGGGGIWSPVVIDTAGNGFDLTDYVNGVAFDLYRAKVYDMNGAHTGRWAWDVFLTVR